MTARHRPVRIPVALALSLALLGGCVGERERLDVPRIALDVTTAAPIAGGRIEGRAAASDESGLIALAVYACSRDSVFRTTESYDRQRSAEIDFSLHVASNATAGAPVEIYTVAYDDQNFSADSARVVHVAGAVGDVTSGIGLCTRLRRSTRATLPTAPGP